MEIKIKKFDPSKISKDKVCVTIGKRGSGKSTLVADLLWYVRSIPLMICMSGTEEGNHYYRSIIPDSYIYGEFKPDVLEAGIKRQKGLMRKGIRKNAELGFLLDDLMYDKSMIKHPLIRQIFMNGRHWKLFFMLTMQYMMDMPPDLRANIDYLFIFRETTPANHKKLYDQFFGIFPNKDSFVDVLMQCTEDYSCLVLDNTSKSNKIEDVVFWYKAEYPLKKYRIGCEKLWNFHKKHYNPKHDHEDDKVDANNLKKKSKLTLKVQKVEKGESTASTASTASTSSTCQKIKKKIIT